MASIIALVLSCFMIIGGILPNYSNKMLEDSLKTAFNNPQKLSVKVHSYPSYGVTWGSFDRVEISAEKVKVYGIPFDSMNIVTGKMVSDYSKITPETQDLSFIKQGDADVMLQLSSESLNNLIDMDKLAIRINNILSNFKIPLPLVSGGISVESLQLDFKNNKPSLSGNIIAMGGFFSAPFSISADLLVTAKNTIEIYEPQITFMEQPLIIDEIQDLTQYINPIFDVSTLNRNGMKLNLKNLYFKDNKLKVIGKVSISN